MNYFVQFQISFFSFFTLIIIYVLLNYRVTLKSYSKSLLNALILFTGIAIIFEPLTWIFDRALFTGAYFLEYSTNFVLLLIGPIIAGLMIAYVDYYVNEDIVKIRKRLFYQFPTILTIILLFLNYFYAFYFTVEKGTNRFIQGDYNWIHYSIIILMYLYMVLTIVKERKTVHQGVTRMFMVFFFLPFLGMIFQMIDSRIFFSWNSLVLAIFVIYIFVESTNNEKDYLTKVFNRYSFEKHLKVLTEKNADFQLISFDLDKFKEINDNLGHLEGDKTLIEFASMLTHACKPNKVVARLGGDEFMAVIEDSLTLSEITNRMYLQLKASQNPTLKDLTFSYGNYRHHNNMTIDELYVAVDLEMYAFKNKNQTLKRRNND